MILLLSRRIIFCRKTSKILNILLRKKWISNNFRHIHKKLISKVHFCKEFFQQNVHSVCKMTKNEMKRNFYIYKAFFSPNIFIKIRLGELSLGERFKWIKAYWCRVPLSLDIIRGTQTKCFLCRCTQLYHCTRYVYIAPLLSDVLCICMNNRIESNYSLLIIDSFLIFDCNSDMWEFRGCVLRCWHRFRQ